MKEKALRSGELARQAGVSPHRLWNYERVGVLPRPRRNANGYRQYDEAALDRVRLVRIGQEALAIFSRRFRRAPKTEPADVFVGPVPADGAGQSEAILSSE